MLIPILKSFRVKFGCVLQRLVWLFVKCCVDLNENINMLKRNSIVWLIPMLAGLVALSAVPAETKICGTTDIKSFFEDFERLRGCTRVQGNLLISILEHHGEQKELEQYTFPELRLINSSASS